MRHVTPLSRLFLLGLLLIAAPHAHAQMTTIGTFTGGDAGEGLDLDGTFVYAVNARGPAAGAVRDAVFTDDSAPGVTLSAPNEILNWSAPNFGATSNDDNLELVMQSIRWANFPSQVTVALANLQPGQAYRLQLLFGEQCCNRGFDVLVEGNEIVNEFAPFATQGSTDLTANGIGAVVTHFFVAGDDTLNIALGGTDTAQPDDNPTLQGFTLEQVVSVEPRLVPTTSHWALLAMSLVVVLAGAVMLRQLRV
jgi:hypothetical protein